MNIRYHAKPAINQKAITTLIIITNINNIREKKKNHLFQKSNKKMIILSSIYSFLFVWHFSVTSSTSGTTFNCIDLIELLIGKTIGGCGVRDSSGSCNITGPCFTFLVRITPTVSSEVKDVQGAS